MTESLENRWEPKHPRWVRWCHWMNFPLLGLMIWSGIWIYWANAVYRVGFGPYTLFHFFPRGLYEPLGVDHHLAMGMAWHFAAMWLFSLNGLIYFSYLLRTGRWRELWPRARSFREAIWVVLHDLHLTRHHPPRRKYNGAQQVAYAGVVLMGGGSLLTGVAIYKPVELGWLAAVLGGYEWARFEHFFLMVGFAGFFVVHVIQVARAGWNPFRAMVMGYERNDAAK